MKKKRLAALITILMLLCAGWTPVLATEEADTEIPTQTETLTTALTPSHH